MKPIYAQSDSSAADTLPSTKVPLGISLVFYGLELTALAIILTFVLPFVAANAGNIMLFLQIVFILAWTVIIGLILGTVGKIFCLTAPNEMEGKGLIYVAVILEVGSIGLNLLEIFQIFSAPWTSPVSSLMILLAFFFFLYFLKSLAVYMSSSDLERSAKALLTVMYTMLVAYAVMIILPFVAFQLIFVSGLIAVVVFILAIFALIRYSRLLLGFKKALSM